MITRSNAGLLCLWCIFLALGLVSHPRAVAQAVPAKVAVELVDEGRYERALTLLRPELERARAEGDSEALAEILLTLAAANRGLGDHCSAGKQLEEALQVGKSSEPLRMRASAALADLLVATRRIGEAGNYLQNATQWAEQNHHLSTQLSLAQTRGALSLLRNRKAAERPDRGMRKLRRFDPDPPEEAVDWFAESVKLAMRLNDTKAVLKARLNHARACLIRGQPDDARALAEESWTQLQHLPETPAHRFLAASNGRLLFELAQRKGEPKEPLMAAATAAYQRALTGADPQEEPRTLSYGHGYLGELHLENDRTEAAERETHLALFYAQAAGCEDARCLWLWQSAKIALRRGQVAKSMESYREAVRILDGLRSDFLGALIVRGGQLSFRESFGRLYSEWAGVLLEQAARKPESGQVPAWQKEACDTLERLRSAELADYYLEGDCVDLIREMSREVQVHPGEAVIYIVPLPDRTELLVTLNSGRRQVPTVAGPILEQAATSWRQQLASPETSADLSSVTNLYNWLIKPIETLLTKASVTNLIFISDTALMAIPMAALHDGQHYLVQRFAVAVLPGLTLMNDGDRRREGGRTLVCGLTNVKNVRPLPHVGTEVASVAKLTQAKVLLNTNFTVPALSKFIRDERYLTIHLGTHAAFGDDANQTYLMTGSGPLTMDQLEQLLLPRLLSRRPLDLLVLSACETAAGSDRAALGLAGVAFKAGVRSTIASLWQVKDESTQQLISDYYEYWTASKGVSKARALQLAQIKMLTQPKSSFKAPYHWSPFVIIGDWR